QCNYSSTAFFGNTEFRLSKYIIQMGNSGSFTIPNNIVMDFRPGNDTVVMNKIGDNITQFNGGFGGGTRSDTFTLTNSIQGATTIQPGSGTNVMPFVADTHGLIQLATPDTTPSQTLELLTAKNGP